MRKNRSLISLLAAALLSSLLLTLLSAGWGFSSSPVSIHAQEIVPADAIGLVNSGYNVDLIGHISGNVYTEDVQGDYAYLGMGSNFVVVDISQPAAPIVVASLSLPQAYYFNIAVENGYAYIIYTAQQTSRLVVVDVRDPTHPVQLGDYESTTSPLFGIVVTGGYAYMASYHAGLLIVDVRDPTNPVEAAFMPMTGGDSHDIVVAGSYAYVSHGSGGLVIVDVGDPTAPVVVGNYYLADNYVDFVAVAGGYAYISTSSGLRIVDVSDPARPRQLGIYNFRGGFVAVAAGHLYVRGYDIGLRVLDVGDPTDPVEVGYYDTPDPAWHVAVADGYVYVAGLDAGLFILRYQPTSYPVAGRVTNWDGAPLPGVELSISPTRTAVTDGAGNYALSGLVTGTYTITPSHPSLIFEPPSRTFSVPPLARQQDFAVSSAPIYAIGGSVYASSFDGPLPFADPVSLHLSNGAQTTTNAGLYTFADLPPGSYVVTPTLADHSFYPTSREVTIPPSNGEQDFIVVKDPTLNILGTVNQSNGEPFAGVQVQVSLLPTTTRSVMRGAALLSTDLGIAISPSTTTDSEGRYAFLNLEPGLYTVTAQLDGYLLLPVSRTAELPTLNEYPFTILPGPVTETASDGLTTTVTLTDTQGLTTVLTFPPDALAEGVEVTVTPVWMPLFLGYASVHHALEVALSSPPGRVKGLDFTLPVSVSVRYSVTDSRTLSDTAAIGLWGLVEEDWQEAGQGCAPSSGQSHDETARVVHAVICQPGLYALAGPTHHRWLPRMDR